VALERAGALALWRDEAVDEVLPVARVGVEYQGATMATSSSQPSGLNTIRAQRSHSPRLAQ
jgi:hypothetical protein